MNDEAADPEPTSCTCPDGDFRFCHGQIERLESKLQEAIDRELAQLRRFEVDRQERADLLAQNKALQIALGARIALEK